MTTESQSNRFVQPLEWIKIVEFRAARVKESALHRAADSHVPALSVSLRYAFAMGRRALRKDRNAGSAIAAVRGALQATLPGTLRKVLAAGGAVAFGKLRVAEFNPDQPRDEKGQWTTAFGTSDPYVYHISDPTIPLGDFARYGLKPSKEGLTGPGVYMANTPEKTQYYHELKDGRLFRIDKTKLIDSFGKYPEKNTGVEFDDHTGEVVLSGDRHVPREFIEVKTKSGWKALGDYEGHPFHGNQWTTDTSQFDREVMRVKGERLNLPIQPTQATAYCEKFGQCTQNAMNEHERSGADVYVGTAVRKDRYSEARQVFERTKGADYGPGVESIPHAWNVMNGHIVDKALGGEAKNYIYFGTKVPEAVLEKIKTGDELALWHIRNAGDYEGHPFHGNQWTEGEDRADVVSKDDLTKYERESLDLYAERGIKVRDMLLVTKSKEAAIQDLDKKLQADGWKKEYSLSLDYEAGSEEHQYSKNGEWLNAYVHPNSRGRTTVVVFDQTPMDSGGQLHQDDVYVPPVVKRLYVLSALRTAKRGDRAALKFRFDASNPHAVDWADRHAAELIDGITETTRERINNAIAEALEGEGIDHAIDVILEAVGDERRAELIARHETMTAASEGQRQAWDQAVDEGLLTGDEKPTWIVVGDEKVCPICEEFDGATRDLDGEYPEPGGSGPPAHVACRCTEGLS